MTDEQIHNLYLEATGKAAGIAEIKGSADFPVIFARAVLDLDKMNRKWVGLTDEERHQISLDNRPYCANIMRAHEEELKRRNT